LDRSTATALLDELHRAQNEFYAGGNGGALRELLAPEIRWVIPGEHPLAGTYHGLEEVFDYFRRGRNIATGTFRMHRRDILVGEGDRIAALTDGTATIAGQARHWSTIGIYDIVDHRRIGSCWLLPFDQAEFDSIWSG
jgi:hypothetical protein